jgi:hypothetical protein
MHNPVIAVLASPFDYASPVYRIRDLRPPPMEPACLAVARPWERGKIGNIETQICRVMICEDRLYTTSELAREIYTNPGWDQNFRLREKGEKVPELKSWHYLAIRKAAPTFW